MLRKCAVNYEVISVDSGKRALEVLGLTEEKAEASHINDQKIDLILSDYCMPEMTGYDLLKAVKDHSITKSIPVVIMSSENNPERVTRCKATGAEEFLLKPLEVQQVEKLRDYVRRPTSSFDPPPMAKPRDRRNMSIDLTAAISGPKRHLRRARIAV
ncbi:two-component response regulator ORR3-like [Typha latifolia]|uniref:two-component response regulator ORR3-like n=1 Tax=Typha latifolia TaxID=4733 RepID=UPI003C2C5C58